MGFYGQDDGDAIARLIDAGWVLVPPEATEAMIEAGRELANNPAAGAWPGFLGHVYRAFIAAAPPPIPTPPQLKEG